jgi:hypothetical protein
MSETQRKSAHTAEDEPYDIDDHPQRTAWVGMVVFAGVMLVMLGSFEAIQGIVALVRDEYYLVTRGGLAITFDYTTWGWIHLILGIVAVITGLGVFLGQTWARVVGIGVAGLSALANMAFLPAYPIWSTIVIAVDVLVIYALAAHGREVRT